VNKLSTSEDYKNACSHKQTIGTLLQKYKVCTVCHQTKNILVLCSVNQAAFLDDVKTAK
jgi:hypothetical protein